MPNLTNFIPSDILATDHCDAGGIMAEGEVIPFGTRRLCGVMIPRESSGPFAESGIVHAAKT
jgi:hypothetical protein